MTDVLAKSLQSEFNRRFGRKDTPVSDHQDDGTGTGQLSCLTFVTQDYDLLIEFIYNFRLKAMPVYFDPVGNWAYIRLPKIKLKWTEDVKQVQLGVRLYNILKGTWVDGRFTPVGTGCKITPVYYPNRCPETVLIPYGDIVIKRSDGESDSDVGKPLNCRYALTYYSICFNRSGLYVNRKYRDKTEITKLETDDYIIIEPKGIEIKDTCGNTLLIGEKESL